VKTTKMLVILVLALAPMASGRQYLIVSEQPLDSIILEVGQSCSFEVASDDSGVYTDVIGFENAVVLGSFLHYKTTKEAGDSARVTPIIRHDFYGYEVTASGSITPPSPGTHFIFEYQAQEPGETDLVLKDGKSLKVLDSVHIRIVPDEMGTAFTYQGRLIDSSTAADGEYDFEFELYDAPFAGGQLGSTIDVNDLDVIDGYFTVELDFGSDVFDGNAVWLEIGVRPGELNDPNVYTTLSPRQELTPTPYALSSAGLTLPYADSAAGSGGPVVSITNNGVGSAIKETGQNGYGVQGESFAAGSSGVFGTNNNTGGYGVFGWSDSGTAVKGFTTGTGVAGLFQIASMGNSNAALEGKTNSTGTGIFGWATAGGGTNYGVRGRTESAAGYAGYFEGRVYASDSVGIGTETPNYKLEVKAPTNQALKLSTESTTSNVDIQAEPTGSGSMRLNVFGGANAITFNVNNIEKLRMNSNGDVGIGTASPGARLEVNGKVKVTGGSPAAGKVLTSDAGGLATWQTPSIGGDSDWLISGNDMYSIPSGNVGIGTTTPTTKLDVTGSINTTASYEIGGQNGLSVYGTGSLSVGPGAGANKTGRHNTFVGQHAGQSNSTGGSNTFLGYNAGCDTTTGFENAFVGMESGSQNTTGTRNTFIGAFAGQLNTTGGANTFLGNSAGRDNDMGGGNTFLGAQAGDENTAGNNNTFVGNLTGSDNTTGFQNTFIGRGAGPSNTTGFYNTFIGDFAGNHNTTGSKNTYLGQYAGNYSTGSGNVFVGNSAGANEAGSNKLYIANTITASPLIYGDFASDLVKINGTLDVRGPIWQRGVVLHADYVFKPGYELESIDKHSEFMWQNKHLPAIPKAMTDENGREIVEVGAHRRGIVEELEKAHIYIDQLHKQNIALETRLAKLEAIVAQMSIAQKGKIE